MVQAKQGRRRPISHDSAPESGDAQRTTGAVAASATRIRAALQVASAAQRPAQNSSVEARSRPVNWISVAPIRPSASRNSPRASRNALQRRLGLPAVDHDVPVGVRDLAEDGVVDQAGQPWIVQRRSARRAHGRPRRPRRGLDDAAGDDLGAVGEVRRRRAARR